jgi:hypothetical protein
VSEPLAHLYALALRALDDQERHADALRGRLAPVLAAAALGTTLLSGPVVGGQAPTSLAGALAIVVAVGGLVWTLVVASHVLLGWRQRAAFDSDVHRLTIALDRAGLLDDVALFYETMIVRISEHGARIETTIDRLEAAFTQMLCGVLVMLCGLALAAVVG